MRNWNVSTSLLSLEFWKLTHSWWVCSSHQIVKMLLDTAQGDMQLLSITVSEDQMSLVHPVGALEEASSR